ncbi:MAG: hypothetical protein ABFD08_18880 [Syntrophomonas sp.]
MNNNPADSNLKKIMEIFDVGGKDLADAIHVDHSLVSKWRLKKRSLSLNSVHTKHLADYFLSLDSPVKYVRIKKLLEASYPQAFTDNNKTIQDLLCKWLCSSDEPNAAQLFVAGKYCRSEVCHVYKGNEGRRQALIDLLEYVLGLPDGCEINMYSHEDMTWMTEDQSFLSRFKEYMLMLLKRNHQISIIHTIDRNPISIMSVLNFWIPIHMTGRLRSYYFPKYVDFTERNFLWMVKGYIAMLGNSCQNDGKNCYSVIYTDSWTLHQYDLLFKSYLQECRPLTSSHHKQMEVFQLINFMSGKPEPAYLISQQPVLASLPAGLLRKVLVNNTVGEDGCNLCMKIHTKWNHVNTSGNSNITTKWIHDFDSINNALAGQETQYELLSQLAGKEVYLSREEVKFHLKNVIHLLESHNNIELALTSPLMGLNHPEANFWLKHNTGIFIWPLIPFRHAVSFSEPTILNAFYNYCEDLWQSIPRLNRDKKRVIDKLSKLIGD